MNELQTGIAILIQQLVYICTTTAHIICVRHFYRLSYGHEVEVYFKKANQTKARRNGLKIVHHLLVRACLVIVICTSECMQQPSTKFEHHLHPGT